MRSRISRPMVKTLHTCTRLLLHHMLSRYCCFARKAREWTEEERQQYRERSVALEPGRHLQLGYHGPRWTAAELALLGTLPDAEVAERIGRTVGAVPCKRTTLGIGTARDRRKWR
jgi:hypothetical protein